MVSYNASQDETQAIIALMTKMTEAMEEMNRRIKTEQRITDRLADEIDKLKVKIIQLDRHPDCPDNEN